ncbi:hypothetical protein ACM46_22625 [Chryseobacterium angstadtii]|uniref:Uncharacterized protein n=1 Tax=Chryseobacterium angstadtii TaxID=558151 RepID=A0A0J7HY79_9FLAO|nr:hypothetical protein ACM46_22625 [Chryseobacterium angstadtii]
MADIFVGKKYKVFIYLIKDIICIEIDIECFVLKDQFLGYIFGLWYRFGVDGFYVACAGKCDKKEGNGKDAGDCFYHGFCLFMDAFFVVSLKNAII